MRSFDFSYCLSAFHYIYRSRNLTSVKMRPKTKNAVCADSASTHTTGQYALFAAVFVQSHRRSRHIIFSHPDCTVGSGFSPALLSLAGSCAEVPPLLRDRSSAPSPPVGNLTPPRRFAVILPSILTLVNSIICLSPYFAPLMYKYFCIITLDIIFIHNYSSM